MRAMAIQRRQILFLVRFAVLSIIFYIPITIPALSRVTVEPFTRGLTSASAMVLNMLGQQVQTAGTIIRGGGFGVDIKNGCNAVEAVAFLAAAVLAFEAPLKLRIVGAIAGSIILEVLNVIRIVTLYLLGRYHRAFAIAFIILLLLHPIGLFVSIESTYANQLSDWSDQHYGDTAAHIWINVEVFYRLIGMFGVAFAVWWIGSDPGRRTSSS